MYQADEANQTSDLTLLNKWLIQRCANTLTWQQELSAPEMVSYLMGWGDHFISHHFVTIHWYAVVHMLKAIHPELRSHQYAFALLSDHTLS